MKDPRKRQNPAIGLWVTFFLHASHEQGEGCNVLSTM